MYAEMDFDIPIGKNGDCYDRYLYGLKRCESLRIIEQCIEKMPADGPVLSDDGGHAAATR